VVDAAQKTKMPDGIFSMIQTASIETATHLVQHPLIKAVGFTGSLKAGRSIYDAAAKREEPIPVYAEMGSTNPVFILPEMMQQKGNDIAKTLAASNVLSTGQFCTNPGIIVAHSSTAAEDFKNTFADCIAENAGDAMLTSAIFSTYQNNIKKLSERNDVQLIRKGIKTEKQNAVAPYMFTASVNSFVENMEFHEEVFGPSSLHIVANNKDEFMKIAESLQGQLTITIWATEKDLNDHRDLINYLELKAGRIIMNGVPTGVEVTHAMMHGGPYPATTDSKFTSVGSTAIYRFTRPVCYQNFDDKFLPEELQDSNPLNILRMINGEFSKSKIE
ncbi:MAG TPA: aldehyde dehydrogenase family protein, partial [Parafilimonas sp.]|nr:aldehyde dehydrogenase family protein [Parafilimonas sp.]